MTLEEIMNMRFGEMIDLITCLGIANGNLKEKPKLSFMEAMELK